MQYTTMGFGVLLIVIGLVGYFTSSGQPADGEATGAEVAADQQESKESEDSKASSSKTALIPTALGVLFLMCGTFAWKEAWRKHAMHVAAGLALVGVLASAGRIGMKLGQGEGIDFGAKATIYLLLMLLICLIFLGLCIRSFILARRARDVEKPAS